jgi:pimeloyl-ACP methyl ester carboxylesterase
MRRWAIRLLVLVVAVAIGPPLLARVLRLEPDPSVRPAPGRAVPIGGGLALNVIEAGSGAPIVLVHGLPSNAYDWADMPQKLAARGYRVIAYDRVGYGYSSRSSHAPDRYTYASNARDLGGLLDALGIERAVLVGWSYGGGVVQTFAAQAPERVSHLVLVAAVGPAQPRSDEPLDRILRSPVAPAIFAWVRSIPPLARSMTEQSLVQAFAGRDAMPPGWVAYTQAMLALPGTLAAFILEAQRADESILRPDALRVPALIIQGTADTHVPPAVADDLHRGLAGSELVTIPDGSHMVPVTHADLLAEKIDTFLHARSGQTDGPA